METRTRRSVSRNRKKSAVPLSKLRTSQAVKTVVDHPRRLEELVSLLEDKDRMVRSHAAAALARLSESHPGRLFRILERVKECLSDDSAYVRWHLAYTLGRLGACFPNRSSRLVGELGARLDDENRIVRVFASHALAQIAERKPELIQELFEATKRQAPASVARVLHKYTRGSPKEHKS
jgi:HEAT repeat protein